MDNLFSKFEEEIFDKEEIIFSEEKIKIALAQFTADKLSKIPDKEKGFYFQDIIYNFFEYTNIPLIKAGKTRDSGLDGVIKIKAELIGELDLGLQIKYKLIDSTDVDLFLSALKNSELQLGLIICKDSRNLNKYELNSKLKAILLSKGINLKERIIKNKIDINPVLIIKFDEILDIIASQIRSFIKGVYKK